MKENLKAGNIDVSSILDEVQSKYLLVMLAANRGRQLALMEQKEKVLESGNVKAKLPDGASELGYLSDKERSALKNHKPIVVALNQLLNNELKYEIIEED